ncbi:hypothetical protein IFM89_004030 [Coptis chinensis]|uniref:Protein kinase domain-containing protein n=1 Tax=Coptis chinensis TaxID=261450 RepID=A0A835LCL6_9MAGN|nr:hypothetical protein IFM89_004030 [Coptis chinensis]
MGKRLVFDEVRRHIIQNGFDLTYTIWSLHGEKQLKYPVIDIVEDENIEDRGLGLENLVDACYGVHEGVRGDVYGGATDQISDFEQPFVPEPDLGKKYAEYKSKAEEKLYPSCEGPVTTLSAVVELHDLKKQYNKHFNGEQELNLPPSRLKGTDVDKLLNRVKYVPATKFNDVKSAKGLHSDGTRGEHFVLCHFTLCIRKSHGYGLAADIWSLGCTVLEMLTRQVPYSHLESRALNRRYLRRQRAASVKGRESESGVSGPCPKIHDPKLKERNSSTLDDCLKSKNGLRAAPSSEVYYVHNGFFPERQEKGRFTAAALAAKERRLLGNGNVANQREHLILPLANVGIRNKAREAYEQPSTKRGTSLALPPSVDPEQTRQTRSLGLKRPIGVRTQALDHHLLRLEFLDHLFGRFFTTKPYPCDPSTLPKYPPSKEFDTKLRDEEARRSWDDIYARQRAAYVKGRESNMGGGIRETPTLQQIQM